MRLTRRHSLHWLAGTAMAPVVGAPALAQSGKKLTILVGFPAGGAVDAIGGTIPSVFTTLPALVQQHKAGKLRILGYSGENRNPGLPEVPTFKESG